MEWKIQAQELFNSIKVWLAPESSPWHWEEHSSLTELNLCGVKNRTSTGRSDTSGGRWWRYGKLNGDQILRWN